MLRRDFLKRAIQAGAILPLASSGLFARPLSNILLPRSTDAEDRVLVLINLNGGNDGLNTVVPINDQHYYDARKTIALQAASTLKIGEGLVGLHGSMPEIQALHAANRCAIVQSVGYPDQDRSHFRSTDIWHTASAADKVIHTGWLGRYLEKSHPEYPATLPAAPFAMQVAASATLALQGDQGDMGMAIDNPDRFYNLANGLSVTPDPLPATLAGPELKFVRDVIAQSNRYSSEIHRAMVDGSTNAQYEGNSLALQLRVVARLINGGLRTGVYIVTLGGFDTHYGQLPQHAQLLSYLSRAVKAFLDDVNTAGNGNRVALMTYSEFGRRVEENGSAGTDHGAASPLMVFGNKVLGGSLLGGAPNLVDLDDRGDIIFRNDFRQVYASALQDWLGFSTADTEQVLGGSFAKLPLFQPQSVGIHDEETAAFAGYRLDQNSPNPVASSTMITFRIQQAGDARLRLLGSDGRQIASLVDRRLDAGEHHILFDASHLPSGGYIYTLECGRYKLSKMMAVVR
jgi:uncharacterized protein (DUF1501 family)